MSGITDLELLLQSLSPLLHKPEYVYCSVDGEIGDYLHLDPVATFREKEGLTLIITRDAAAAAGLRYDGVFRLLTLQIHSSLHAVGLTARVAAVLAENGVSANMIAACFHDHILVPADKAELACAAIRGLSAGHRNSR